jgi:hypothetical protein
MGLTKKCENASATSFSAIKPTEREDCTPTAISAAATISKAVAITAQGQEPAIEASSLSSANEDGVPGLHDTS